MAVVYDASILELTGTMAENCIRGQVKFRPLTQQRRRPANHRAIRNDHFPQTIG